MKSQFVPVPKHDPAGLDELLIAGAKGVTRFLESRIGQTFGRPINLWDGADGLGAVLSESIKAVGVPNKRLPELLTPRAVVETVMPIRPMRPRMSREMKARRRMRRTR